MAEKGKILGVNVALGDAVTVTASTEEGDFIAENVLTFDPGEVWRATGNSGETLTFAFGEGVDIDHVAVIGHNGSLSAVVRIEIASDAGFSTVFYDQTFDLWPPIYGLGEGGLGNHLGGYVDPAELAVFVPYRIIALGAVYSHGFMRLTLTDTGASAPARLEVGHVMAGVAETFERNFGFGWSWQEVDPSEHTRTDGGALLINERPTYPRLNVTWPALSQSEAITKIRTLKRTNGRRRPVLVILFPDAPAAKFYSTSIYGVFAEYTPETHLRVDRASQGFTVEGLVP